jgi:hypothetical protein
VTHAAGTLAEDMLELEPNLHRLSYADVMRMYDVGILEAEDRVELLDGVLFDMKDPEAPEHSGAIAWLNRQLVTASPDVDVRVQSVMFVAGGFVRPDVLVIDPLTARDRHPDTGRLAVEVSVTSQRHDHAKVWRYARARVGETWIVDLPSRTVFLHREPRGDHYATVARLTDGDRLRVPFADVELDVGELLGPAT